jgi:hypothetical protein
MAKKPDGAAAGVQRVAFTKAAADRIGRVVREVEGGDRDNGPLTFGMRAVSSNAKVFRVATFTGSWSKGSSKTVTFKNQTSTPNTASATNLFAAIGTASQSTRNCAIAKEGTAWYLIAAECS